MYPHLTENLSDKKNPAALHAAQCCMVADSERAHLCTKTICRAVKNDKLREFDQTIYLWQRFNHRLVNDATGEFQSVWTKIEDLSKSEKNNFQKHIRR